MGSYQHTTEQNAAQSSQQHVPPTVVPQPPQVQQQTIQAKSNEEGLAEHAERLRKFERLGSSFLDKGPPRLSNDKTSPLQPKAWIQRKLAIGEPGDKYEQEADRVASQVVQQINAPAPKEKNLRQSIQREKDLEGVKQARCFRAAIQRKKGMAEGEASNDLESAINSARGGGQPLDPGLQQSMGQAMGADFSGVRVHTNAQSDQLNQSIQARAFTTGQDVFFRDGAYQPRSRGGQELIAHELTHIVQQDKETVQRIQKSSPNLLDPNMSLNFISPKSEETFFSGNEIPIEERDGDRVPAKVVNLESDHHQVQVSDVYDMSISSETPIQCMNISTLLKGDSQNIEQFIEGSENGSGHAIEKHLKPDAIALLMKDREMDGAFWGMDQLVKAVREVLKQKEDDLKEFVENIAEGDAKRRVYKVVVSDVKFVDFDNTKENSLPKFHFEPAQIVVVLNCYHLDPPINIDYEYDVELVTAYPVTKDRALDLALKTGKRERDTLKAEFENVLTNKGKTKNKKSKIRRGNKKVEKSLYGN